ncbi:MAG: helix-turn-helix domain-containing protein [Gemmatimonadota bacterium]|nr:helix-turn-helix domain-containing protein [Gemmatimonadota bacterium]
MNKKRPYVVRSHDQLLALASPGREDIIDAVTVLGPCGVTDIAKFVGRPRHALYYHVKALRDRDLLVETQVKGKGVKPTAHYDLPGRPFLVRYDLSSPKSRRAVIAIGRARFKAGRRGFVRACSAPSAIVEGQRRNLWVAHWKGWLTVKDLEKANRLLSQLVDVFTPSTGTATRGREPYELTFAVSPVIRANAKPGTSS